MAAEIYRRGARSARRERMDHVEQLLEAERLRNDAVGFGDRLRVQQRTPGEENHGRTVVAFPQRPHQLHAVVGADMDVEEDQVDPSLREPLLGRGYGRSLGDAVAVELEVHAAEKSQRLVVVDDQDQRYPNELRHRVSPYPLRPFNTRKWERLRMDCLSRRPSSDAGRG